MAKEEPRSRTLSSAQLQELEAKFQAIIDSNAGNAARRCVSLCLAREQVAAEEERHHQLLSFAEFSRVAPVLQQPQQTPQPSPRRGAREAYVPAWTHGFYDEKTRAVGSGAVVRRAAPKDPSLRATVEDGDSSDEDYARILRSAYGLRDQVHSLLVEEGRRQRQEEEDGGPMQRRVSASTGIDYGKIVGMASTMQARFVAASSSMDSAETAASGTKRRLGARDSVGRVASSASGRGAERAAPSRPQPALPVDAVLLEEPSGPCVRLLFALRSIDFRGLSESPSLVGDLEAGLKEALSRQAGEQVRPSHVALVLCSGPAGSVTVKVTVTPPTGVEAESVRLALGDVPSLSAAVLSKASATPGLAAVSDGDLAVWDVRAPCVQECPPVSPAPPSPPSWTMMTPRESAASARMSERKAANEGLQRELAELAAQLRRSNIIRTPDDPVDEPADDSEDRSGLID
uniref:Uncharacterized protein n=1 Tax=Alexandrium catenella TaxID=2925 RepID=A0A7S1PU80_ALECA|mmetsp:Transcript_111215/g.295576  ORF Transcript_111215/g.295576 Transcript_111215/m.295576 type:complete len:459 (+) Transcript_111215:84-1460(+)